MLRMAIEKVLKKEGIKGEVEASDIGVASSQKCDLIVTSPELLPQIKHKTAAVIAVRNITDEKEIREKLLPAITKE